MKEEQKPALQQTNVLRRLILVLKLVGTPNWYQGVDKPSFAQWLYKWRIGWRTAYKVAKIIHD